MSALFVLRALKSTCRDSMRGAAVKAGACSASGAPSPHGARRTRRTRSLASGRRTCDAFRPFSLRSLHVAASVQRGSVVRTPGAGSSEAARQAEGGTTWLPARGRLGSQCLPGAARQACWAAARAEVQCQAARRPASPRPCLRAAALRARGPGASRRAPYSPPAHGHGTAPPAYTRDPVPRASLRGRRGRTARRGKRSSAPTLCGVQMHRWSVRARLKRRDSVDARTVTRRL